MTPAGLPHSEILGSQVGYHLPEAYRRFLRPSSAPDAKASTVCPYQLCHKDSFDKDARVHCAVLKKREAPHGSPTPAPPTTTTAPATSCHDRSRGTDVGADGAGPGRDGSSTTGSPEQAAHGRSLRTQQRARRTGPHHRRSFPPPEGRRSPGGELRSTGRCENLTAN